MNGNVGILQSGVTREEKIKDHFRIQTTTLFTGDMLVRG